MTEKPQLNDMHAQATIDDARIDARMKEIMGNTSVPKGRRAAAAAHVNPSWLTSEKPPAPVAEPASKKSKRSTRRTVAKPAVSAEEKWNRAARDEAANQEGEE